MDMNTFDRDAFIKERDEAFLSLDKEKIIKYLIKYEIPFSTKEKIFWASIHKAILYIHSATDKQLERSIEWLISNGFKPSIDFGATMRTFI